MNVNLLKFMNRKVRIREDTDNEIYTVLGIYWASEQIVLSVDRGTISVPYRDLDLVPEDSEDYDND